MEMYTKYRVADRPRPCSSLGGEQTALTVAVLFWACGGVWWRDKKGYHAQAASRNKIALLFIQQALKGRIVWRRVAKGQGYWQWLVERKAAVEWLDRQMTVLFLPALPEPDRSICRHCGQEDGYHEQECPEAPGG